MADVRLKGMKDADFTPLVRGLGIEFSSAEGLTEAGVITITVPDKAVSGQLLVLEASRISHLVGMAATTRRKQPAATNFEFECGLMSQIFIQAQSGNITEWSVAWELATDPTNRKTDTQLGV